MTADIRSSDQARNDKRHPRVSMLSWRLDASLRDAFEEEQIENERDQQLVRRLLTESRTAELMHLVLIAVVAFLYWGVVAPTGLVAWIAAVVAATLVRALVRHRLASGPTSASFAVRNIRRIVLLSALAWAVGPAVFAGGLQIADWALLMVVFAGLVAGASSTLLADARSFYYFMAGMLGPFTVAVLMSGQTRTHLVTATLVVLFAATMFVTFRRSHAQLIEYVTASMRLKLSEREANRGRNFLNALLSSAPTAIVTVDASGMVLGVNPAFERLFGFSAAEAIGQELNSLIVPEADRESARILDEQVRTGRLVVADLPRKTKNGNRIWVQASSGTVREEFGHGVWFVMYEDITMRRRISEEREQAKEAAEQAARAKAAFLANMSHEIRTPMNGVLGMIELLLEGDLTPDQRHLAEEVRSSGDALLNILNDILDFSKIDAGQLELERIPFSIEKTITATARMLMVPAAKRGNELHLDVGSDLPPLLLGDPGRLRQVVTNLLGNAIKFTKNGEIVVSVGVEGERNGQPLVRVSVQDTGIGIPPDKAESIFDEFTQADASVTRTHGGTGLGLAISRRIVEQMGGQLRVVSEVGKGSKFRFVVPMDIAPASTDRDRRQSPPVKLEGRRFLSVDDNETARRIVREALESVGAFVDEADSADNALERLTAAAQADALYDAAIIDSMMPRRDGFALAVDVQADPRLKGLRILMLTSAQVGEGPKKAREYGIAGYLTKPVTRAGLVEAVQALMGLRGPGEQPERRLITEETLAKDRPLATVLLAEDNKTNQQIAVAMLTKRGHEVDVAETGVQALEMVIAKRYDVVLMDIQMPEMDGLEATRAIRAMREFENLPIVACTAHALAEERERCKAAGMNGFLSKPFKPHELQEAVEQWLRFAETPPEADTEVDMPDTEETSDELPVDVEEFRSMMREAGVEEVVPVTLATYLEETPAKLQALAAAVSEGNGAAVEKTAHALKSASGAIRAHPLAGLLQQLEDAGVAGEMDRANELHAAVVDQYDRVVAFLGDHLAGAD